MPVPVSDGGGVVGSTGGGVGSVGIGGVGSGVVTLGGARAIFFFGFAFLTARLAFFFAPFFILRLAKQVHRPNVSVPIIINLRYDAREFRLIPKLVVRCVVLAGEECSGDSFAAVCCWF